MIFHRNKYLLKSILIIAAGVIVFLLWKSISKRDADLWNNVMLFVNFGILVFLFIKFAKKPLIDFLKGEGKKISKDITAIEGQVKEARSIMDAEAAKLEGIDERIHEIKEQILEIGKREKDKIIEKAEAAARQMIEDAEREAQYRLEKAKRRFGEEMLDMAISLAVEKLKKGFTQDDNEMIIDQFSETLSSEKGYFT